VVGTNNQLLMWLISELKLILAIVGALNENHCHARNGTPRSHQFATDITLRRRWPLNRPNGAALRPPRNIPAKSIRSFHSYPDSDLNLASHSAAGSPTSSRISHHRSTGGFPGLCRACVLVRFLVDEANSHQEPRFGGAFLFLKPGINSNATFGPGPYSVHP